MQQVKYVTYLRVSTQKQGVSGLGLEAQRAAVSAYVGSRGAQVIQEFVETESGKGADALDRRHQLRAALVLAKKQSATLLIAKLDRLARSVHFVSGLLETGVEFVAADMPMANKVMIQMFSVMAEWERDQISARTKAALAAAKARGVVIGRAGPANLRPNIEARQQAARAFAERLRPVLAGFRSENLSAVTQVDRLNALGISAPRGGKWSRTQLRRVARRLNDRSENPEHRIRASADYTQR